MPEVTSGSTFLGNETTRKSLHSLWIALNNNDLTSNSLILDLDDLILDWEKSKASLQPVACYESADTVGVSTR